MTDESKHFDEIAKDYDKAVGKSPAGYPFEGYRKVLKTVQEAVRIEKGTKILDIGIGTGLLTQALYKSGAEIFGVDFSEQMIELAQLKMPEAKIYCFDYSSGLPQELKKEQFDYIVSSYSMHHLNDENKLRLIKLLANNLKKNGKMFFADISFETKEEMYACKTSAGNKWDYSEYYLIGTEMVKKLKQTGFAAVYKQISKCAGIIEILKAA